MSETIKETQEKLKSLGYFSSEELAKKVLLFEESGKRKKKSIPTLLLQGKSGAGKTFLAETFSQMINADERFVQCFPRMGTENFQYDVNIEGVMRQDADKSIKEGILLQVLQQSHKGPVVLVIDELDKARPEVDSFLLDFLENGRLTTGTDTFEKGEYPIYTFITSNDKREIDDALINRSKRVVVPRPSKELFLEILGVPQNHYLGYFYDKCEDFSIRQARQYLEDLEVLEKKFDEDALSQYINLDDANVMSLADIQMIEEIEGEGLRIDLPELETCEINLTKMSDENISKFYDLVKRTDEKIEIESRDYESYSGRTENLFLILRNTKQLELLAQYGLTDFDYQGWFMHDFSTEDMEDKNIIWASNKSKIDGTRFGVKVVGDKAYRIAMNRGNTFVYLNSREKSLEEFTGKQVDDSEKKFEADFSYGE